jgi:hypothetical protein
MKSPSRVVVVELDQSMSRRNPTLPHLYVGLTKSDIEERFRDLQRGAGPPELAGKYLRLRMDLVEVKEDLNHQRTAKAILRREKLRLTKLGYAINGISTVWTTYVIDLDPTGIHETGEGYVYVGQTSHTPEERLAIHKGPKPEPPARDLRSKIVNKRGLGLNYELMARLTPSPPVFTQHDALSLEKKWARKLHQMGYRVEAGDATPGREVYKDREKG